MSDTPLLPLPVDPAPAVARRRERVGLHLFLLGMTFLTTSWAGIWIATGEFIPTSIAQAASGLPYSIMVIAILGAHEMGHYLTCRRYGVDASPPFFLPGPPLLIGTFGAFIRLREPMRTRKVLFDVGVAGPIAGFVVMLPILAWAVATAEVVPATGTPGLTFGEPMLLKLMAWLCGRQLAENESLLLNPAMMAAWVGCLATALNLLPVGQLDGGHVLYAVSRRFHRTVAPLALALFCIAGALLYPGYIVFAMVLVFAGSKHPQVIDESGDIGTGRMMVALLALVILVLCFVPGPVSGPVLTEP